MTVVVIIGCYDFEWAALGCSTCAALDLNRILLAALRRCDRSDEQLTELHLCFHTKEVLRACHQTVVQWQAYISKLQLLEDIFLEPGVFDFHIVLIVE